MNILFNHSAVAVDGMTARKKFLSSVLSLFLLFVSANSAGNSHAQAVDIEVAKKDGKVVLYGTVVPQAMESIFNSFEKKYGIKVDYWRASANGVTERAVNEWRAGRPGYDVVEGNPGLNLALKTEGALAKYIPPSSEKFAEQFKDKDRQMTAWRLIPMLMLTAEASYHAPYDHCTVKYLQQAGLRPSWIKLADLGIRGNSHVMMLEKNNRQIAAVIARWLDKTLPPAKKNGGIAAR